MSDIMLVNISMASALVFGFLAFGWIKLVMEVFNFTDDRVSFAVAVVVPFAVVGIVANLGWLYY